ncbi:MAG: flippase-like domain-containing protein [Chloroflexi bacterium]|nr:flippase-like domain-containing protein [Chloroflexota bacterium]
MTNWRIWLGLAISAASIVLVLRQVDLSLVAAHVGRSDPRWLAVLVASVPITLWMKAARWRLFFRPSDPVSTTGLFSALYIGYTVSVVAPLRAGELVRVFLVADRDQLGWARVLATVLVEKVLDVLAVAVLLVAVAAVVPLPEWAARGAQMAGLLVLGSLAGLATLLFMERTLQGALARLERALPALERLRLGAFLVSFNQGLAFVRSPGALARVALWTVCTWLMAMATVWTGLVGTGLAASTGAVVFVLAVTNLGMVVPSGPGYVGYYHSLVVLSLGAFGVDPNQALGTALVMHALTYGAVLVGGLLFLWRGQYGMAKLLRSSRLLVARDSGGGDAETRRRGDVGRASTPPLPASADPASARLRVPASGNPPASEP